MANLARVFLFYCCAMLLAPLALFADPLAWPVTMYHNLQDFFGPNATSTLLVVAGQHSEWTTPQGMKPMDHARCFYVLSFIYFSYPLGVLPLSFYRLFIFGMRSEFYLLSFYDYYYYYASFTTSFTLLPLLNNTPPYL